MRGSIKIFTIFGIDIKLHYSWWFVFVLLAYLLSTSLFPDICSGNIGELVASNIVSKCSSFSVFSYWVLGILSSLLLFASVLLHELTHSLVAKFRKIEVESITLFFFGGVASLPSEEMKPWTEFWMALSGPVFSLALAGVFYSIYLLNGNIYLTLISFYLAFLNFMLAIFNLLPGYPLDGGRVFRALLNMYFKDIKKATWVASKGGKFVGGVLVFLGIFSILSGLWNGLWFVFLGGFLWFIAGLSYEQIIVKEVLNNVPLLKLVKKNYNHFTPEMTFDKVIKKFQITGEENFVVKKGGKILGIIDLRRIGRLDKQTWGKVLVRSVMVPVDKIKILNERETSYIALRKMMQQNFLLLPVLKKGKIMGIIYEKSLKHQLAMKLKYKI